METQFKTQNQQNNTQKTVSSPARFARPTNQSSLPRLDLAKLERFC